MYTWLVLNELRTRLSIPKADNSINEPVMSIECGSIRLGREDKRNDPRGKINQCEYLKKRMDKLSTNVAWNYIMITESYFGIAKCLGVMVLTGMFCAFSYDFCIPEKSLFESHLADDHICEIFSRNLEWIAALVGVLYKMNPVPEIFPLFLRPPVIDLSLTTRPCLICTSEIYLIAFVHIW